MAHLSADALTLSHQVGTSQHEGRYGQNPARLPFSKPVHVHFPFAETLKGHMKRELGSELSPAFVSLSHPKFLPFQIHFL